MQYLISEHFVIFLIVFILTLIIGPIMIPILRRLKFGQTVRDDGPSTHLIKTGTPTMGGVIFLIPVIVVCLILARQYPRVLPLIFVMVGFGFIGFIDDFIKVVKKRKDGLYAKQKMFLLIIVSSVFSFYVYSMGLGSDINIPFFGSMFVLDIAWFFIPFCILVLIATGNSVNITDGLDGLASGVTLIVMVFFTVVSVSNPDWANVKIISSALAGGCLGFLVFNMHPARVFMGDTGSHALGGAVGAIAIMLKMPLILLVVGLIYVIEALSVMIQVFSFKLRGKRVFKMAPIHHHFELLGWEETKVVTVFWSFTLVMCVIGYFLIRS